MWEAVRTDTQCGEHAKALADDVHGARALLLLLLRTVRARRPQHHGDGVLGQELGELLLAVRQAFARDLGRLGLHLLLPHAELRRVPACSVRSSVQRTQRRWPTGEGPLLWRGPRSCAVIADAQREDGGCDELVVLSQRGQRHA